MADVDITVSDEYISRGGFGTARKEVDELGKAVKKTASETDMLAQRVDKAFKSATKSINVSGVTLQKDFMGNFKKLMKDTESSAVEGGSRAGSSFADMFQQAWQVAPAQIKGAMIATLVTAAVAAAPFVGGALAGGVVTAFGLGLGGLGLAFAGQATEIRALVRDTGKDMSRDMTLISMPFKQTIVDMVGSAKREFADLRPTLTRVFADMAPDMSVFGDNFIRGIGEFESALEPLSRAFQRVIGDLGPRVPGVIKGIADALSDLSDSVDANPRALGDMIEFLGNIAEVGIGTVEVLNNIYAGHRDLFNLLTKGPQAMDDWTGTQNSLTGAVLDGGDATFKYADALKALDPAYGGVRSQTEVWAAALEELANAEGDVVRQGQALQDMMNIMAGRSPNFEEAIQAMQDTLRDLNEDISDGILKTDGWGSALLNANGTVNTAVKNGSMLQDVVVELQEGFANASAAAQELAEREGISLAEASSRVSANLQTQRDNLIATAQRMGLTRDEANKLANAYGLIPRSVVTDVILRHNAYAVLAQVQGVMNQIGSWSIWGKASGGAVGALRPAADGGMKGPNVLMNDGNGPEAVRLPNGSTVFTAEETRGMNDRWEQAMGTGGGQLTYTGMGPMGGLERLFFTFLQEAIRNNRLQIPGVNA